MTFSEIKQTILDLCLLRSQDADTRVGRSVNQHYKQITADLGMDPTRFVTRSQAMTPGQKTVTFSNIEKIDRILDTTDGVRELTPASMDEIRTDVAGTDQPERWALSATTATTMTILTDTAPQSAYTLQADGWATLSDLDGNDEPVFAESYHNILVYSVAAEEFLRKRDLELAGAYKGQATDLTNKLKLHFADSPATTLQQNSRQTVSGGISASGSGSGSQGGTAYTQSALLTFDRGAGIAPFVVARSDAAVVTNLDADKLDGQHGSYYTDRSNHTGVLGVAILGSIGTDRLVGRDTAGTGTGEQLTIGGGLEFTGSGGIQIADNGITYAKMQNVSAASRLVGRGSAAGAGDPEELTIGSGIQLVATAITLDLTWICDGRLTLTTATPVTTADVTAATTVYFTPYRGNRIALYTGTIWTVVAFSELSIAVPATTNQMYDVFVDYNAGTPILAVTAWTNDTTRATALTTQNGVLVQTGNTDWRYVGSFRTTGVSGQTEDSYAKRYVWNYANRVARPLRVTDGTNDWSYTLATLRQANGAATNQLDLVSGWAEDALDVAVIATSASDTANTDRGVAIGEDSTSAKATGSLASTAAGTGGHKHTATARYHTIPAVGRHYYVWLEWSTAAGTTTWYGDNGAAFSQSGITGLWRA